MKRRTGFAPKGMSPEEVAQIAKNKLPNADVQIDGDTVRIYGATEQEWVTVTNTHRQEFDGGGMRDVETGKPRFDLLCPERVPYEHQYLTRVAKLMGRGAEHYEDRNWEQFADDAAYQRARSSAFRHFMQWFNGETDEDHAASIFFNVQAAEYVAGRMRGDW